MGDDGVQVEIMILLAGGLVVASIVAKPLCQRLRVPPLVVFLGIGLLINSVDYAWPFLSDAGQSIFDFLAQMGVIAILFRAGLECDVRGLLKQLRGASFIWLGDVTVSGIVGFLITHYVLGFPLAPSLVVATAMTATSVGMTVPLWQKARALDTDTGRKFLDVAELDDISGVVLMALLFSILPALNGTEEGSLAATVVWEVGRFALTLLVFGALCIVMSLYLEEPLSRLMARFEPQPDDMLVVVGISMMIAAAAGLLGFSAAIGAFFAGLVFSRDPQRVHYDASFSALYDLFTPFFFIGIGMTIAPDALTGAVGIGLVFLLAASTGKMLGAGLFSLPLVPSSMAALTLGVSMVPRAEICMVIMQKGHGLGPEVVPPVVFSGMVLVSAVTCSVIPFIVGPMLVRYVAPKVPSSA